MLQNQLSHKKSKMEIVSEFTKYIVLHWPNRLEKRPDSMVHGGNSWGKNWV